MTSPSLNKEDVLPAARRGLSHPKRFITGHDSKGNADFNTSLTELIPFQQIPGDALFSLCYATNEFPVTLDDDADVKVYSGMQYISTWFSIYLTVLNENLNLTY